MSTQTQVHAPRPCRECGALFVPSHGTTRVCSDACRDLRTRARRQRWRARNPDHGRDYYHANTERMRRQQSGYRLQNQERLRLRARWYYLQNQERLRQYWHGHYLRNYDRKLEYAGRYRRAQRAVSLDHDGKDDTRHERAEYELFQRAASRTRERTIARDRLLDLCAALSESERALLSRLLRDGLDELSDVERDAFRGIRRKARCAR